MDSSLHTVPYFYFLLWVTQGIVVTKFTIGELMVTESIPAPPGFK